jgi:hypothetical protein
MGWPYHLLDLTHEQKHERRLLLDRYGVYAQLSALIPILGYQLYRLAIWVYSERQRPKTGYSAIPSSPTLKRARTSASGTLSARLRSIVWWLESEVAKGWGLRGQWIAAACWLSWLLFLCVHQTGEGKILRVLVLHPQCYQRLLARPILHLSWRFSCCTCVEFAFCGLLTEHCRCGHVCFYCLYQNARGNFYFQSSSRFTKAY